MYNPNFETLILNGMEEEEYQKLLRELAEEEAETNPPCEEDWEDDYPNYGLEYPFP